jgi:hypothetical protein
MKDNEEIFDKIMENNDFRSDVKENAHEKSLSDV